MLAVCVLLKTSTTCAVTLSARCVISLPLFTSVYTVCLILDVPYTARCFLTNVSILFFGVSIPGDVVPASYPSDVN